MTLKMLEAKLAIYVNAAADLAESVRLDIVDNDEQISKDTILALNRFVQASQEVAVVTNALQPDNTKLN
jgi:hypothetical protein